MRIAFIGQQEFGEAALEAADMLVAARHEERAQDESQASYEGWYHEDESRINWANHVDQVYNLIRACNPAPGAWTVLNGTRVGLTPNVC